MLTSTQVHQLTVAMYGAAAGAYTAELQAFESETALANFLADYTIGAAKFEDATTDLAVARIIAADFGLGDNDEAVQAVIDMLEAGDSIGQCYVNAIAYLTGDSVAADFADAAADFVASVEGAEAFTAANPEASDIDALQEAVTEGTGGFTLTAALAALDLANENLAAFLVTADGDDDAETSATAAELTGDVDTAVEAIDALVTAISAVDAEDDAAYEAGAYEAATAGVQAAIKADVEVAAAALLAAAETDLSDAQDDVAAVAGLAAAQAAYEAAVDANEAAALAYARADAAVDTAVAALAINAGEAVSDAAALVDGAYEAGDVVTVGADTVIEYDAEDETFVLAAEVTEVTHEGVGAVLAALNAAVAAYAADVAADDTEYDAMLNRDILDLTAEAEAAAEAVAAAFSVNELAAESLATVADMRSEISALETLIAQAATDIAGAADAAALDAVLANYATAGLFNSDDVLMLTDAYDTAIGLGDTHAEAIDAVELLDQDLNNLNREAGDYEAAEAAVADAADGLQVLVDALIDLDNDIGGVLLSETNTLTDALVDAEEAITNDAEDGIQDTIDAWTEAFADLAEAEALVDEYDALVAAVEAAEDAFVDAEYDVPVTIDAASEFATTGADIFLVGDLSGVANASTVLSFGLVGDDKIYLGSDYTYNMGDVDTDGDNAVLEAFISEVGGNAVVTLELEAFGSNAATPEVVEITLSGVAAADITIADGFVSLV